MSNLLNIGISGLNAQKTALAVTGHNITNAGTEGYSRQTVSLNENSPQFKGRVWVGSGVNIASVKRVYDQFLTEQSRRDNTSFSEFTALANNAKQIDSLLADPGTGIQPGVKKMFGALQSAIDDPASLPAREVLISEASGLISRFTTINDRLLEQNKILNGQLSVVAGQITTIGKAIAELNEQIQFATASAQGNEPNDLLDQRDKLLKDLSKYVKVNVVQQDDAGINVFIGNGQALVIGNENRELFVQAGESDPSRVEVFFRRGEDENSIVQNITAEIKGGEMGGMLSFRQQVLDPTINGLGRLAITINQTFNQQHKLGIDYDGRKGVDFFTSINDQQKTFERVINNRSNEGPGDRQLAVHIKDAGKLNDSEYRVEFTGPDDLTYKITRLSDKEVVAKQALKGAFPDSINIDGFELQFQAGSFRKGDKFLLLPTRSGANHMGVNLTRPEQVALASPIKTSTSTGNQGSAKISQGRVYDTNTSYLEKEGEVEPPLIIRFTSSTSYDVLDNTDPARPIPLFPPLMNQTYVSGISNKILPTDTGKKAFTSFGGYLPVAATYQPPAPSAVVEAKNGFFPERIVISREDPVTGQKQSQPVLITPANASAKEIARLLSERDGVQASARTTVQLSDFKNDPGGFMSTQFQLNGVTLTDNLGTNQTKYDKNYPETVPDPVTPDFLAERINANFELREQGTIARSDGKTLTVINLKGDDINVELTGDIEDGFSVSNGQDINLKQTGNTPIRNLTKYSGFDFSKDGPYSYSFDVPGQGEFSITLDEKYDTGTDLIAGIRDKLEKAGFSFSGNLDVDINERGQISFQPRLAVTATGPNGSSKINMGGQVKVITDTGYSLEIEPPGNNLFPARPEGKPIHFGFEVDISGLAKKGDEFTIGFNDKGSSDSRNGNALASLRSQKVINGNTSYSESYARLVEKVGSISSRAEVSRNSAEVLKRNSDKAVSSVSAVNLDEEAASLIKYQLAYNASAQVIKTAQTIFDTLISTFR